MAAESLAFHGDKDRDLMKDIGTLNDGQKSASKRMPPDQKRAVGTKIPSGLGTADEQTRGKRPRVESQRDDIVKTSKRQRCDNVEYVIKYKSELTHLMLL